MESLEPIKNKKEIEINRGFIDYALHSEIDWSQIDLNNQETLIKTVDELEQNITSEPINNKKVILIDNCQKILDTLHKNYNIRDTRLDKIWENLSVIRKQITGQSNY